jgi:hypothetical protein
MNTRGAIEAQQQVEEMQASRPSYARLCREAISKLEAEPPGAGTESQEKT